MRLEYKVYKNRKTIMDNKKKINFRIAIKKMNIAKFGEIIVCIIIVVCK